MKSFFSRLHDTQTGHSKSASKETYKFWIPNSNAGRDSPKPNFVRENAAPVQSARPQAEKRSSSRAHKQSNPVPVSSQDKSAPPTNITSTAPITQHPTYAAATYTVPSSHHASTSAQPISHATTTRHHGYYNDKAQMLSPPAAYPSYSTKTWSQQQIPTKSAPQASTSHAVPAASQHELWAPTYLPSPSKQAEDPAKPLESAEPLVKHLVYTSEKERAPETGKRDRDRPKEKERDRRREKGVDREKGRHLVKEQISENPRERERTRPRERDKGAERDLKEREYRDREREREADRRRDHDRDRQRERARERENEQKERDKEAELEKERDRRDREREQREREQRERDQRERDQREREYKEREQREREHKEREQREREQRERDQREREYKEREQREREQREREQRERDQREREYKEREQKEREQRERDQREREYKEREQREREQRERDQREREQRERDQREREQGEREYREREQREREQKQERDRREREREQREKEREQERDRERERERRERERARVYDREKREREKERERERYRTKERDQVDHERGKVRADNAIKGSPTTKMKDRAVGEAIGIPDDPQRVAQPEVIKAEPYSQSSNIRKERDVRTTRDHHRSKRRDAEQRYRAEATDGEQVSRRAKPRTSQADRLKEDRQGWVSDTFATDERKFYRPVIAREQPPIDEGENSDNSQARIGSRATQRQPRADVNDPISKDRLPQNSTTLSQVPEYMQSRVVHGVLESQPPVSATPLQMHVHLPPKDSRTADRPVQLLANDIAANDAVVPVRREINRLKLNSRQDELRPSFPEVLPRTVDPSSSQQRPPLRTMTPAIPQHISISQSNSSQPRRSGVDFVQTSGIPSQGVMQRLGPTSRLTNPEARIGTEHDGIVQESTYLPFAGAPRKADLRSDATDKVVLPSMPRNLTGDSTFQLSSSSSRQPPLPQPAPGITVFQSDSSSKPGYSPDLPQALNVAAPSVGLDKENQDIKHVDVPRMKEDIRRDVQDVGAKVDTSNPPLSSPIAMSLQVQRLDVGRRESHAFSTPVAAHVVTGRIHGDNIEDTRAIPRIYHRTLPVDPQTSNSSLVAAATPVTSYAPTGPQSHHLSASFQNDGSRQNTTAAYAREVVPVSLPLPSHESQMKVSSPAHTTHFPLVALSQTPTRTSASMSDPKLMLPLLSASSKSSVTQPDVYDQRVSEKIGIPVAQPASGTPSGVVNETPAQPGFPIQDTNPPKNPQISEASQTTNEVIWRGTPVIHPVTSQVTHQSSTSVSVKASRDHLQQYETDNKDKPIAPTIAPLASPAVMNLDRSKDTLDRSPLTTKQSIPDQGSVGLQPGNHGRGTQPPASKYLDKNRFPFDPQIHPGYQSEQGGSSNGKTTGLSVLQPSAGTPNGHSSDDRLENAAVMTTEPSLRARVQSQKSSGISLPFQRQDEGLVLLSNIILESPSTPRSPALTTKQKDSPRNRVHAIQPTSNLNREPAVQQTMPSVSKGPGGSPKATQTQVSKAPSAFIDSLAQGLPKGSKQNSPRALREDRLANAPKVSNSSNTESAVVPIPEHSSLKMQLPISQPDKYLDSVLEIRDTQPRPSVTMTASQEVPQSIVLEASLPFPARAEQTSSVGGTLRDTSLPKTASGPPQHALLHPVSIGHGHILPSSVPPSLSSQVVNLHPQNAAGISARRGILNEEDEDKTIKRLAEVEKPKAPNPTPDSYSPTVQKHDIPDSSAGKEVPSLGFFTTTFSTALNAPVKSKPSGHDSRSKADVEKKSSFERVLSGAGKPKPGGDSAHVSRAISQSKDTATDEQRIGPSQDKTHSRPPSRRGAEANDRVTEIVPTAYKISHPVLADILSSPRPDQHVPVASTPSTSTNVNRPFASGAKVEDLKSDNLVYEAQHLNQEMNRSQAPPIFPYATNLRQTSSSGQVHTPNQASQAHKIASNPKTLESGPPRPTPVPMDVRPFDQIPTISSLDRMGPSSQLTTAAHQTLRREDIPPAIPSPLPDGGRTSNNAQLGLIYDRKVAMPSVPINSASKDNRWNFSEGSSKVPTPSYRDPRSSTPSHIPPPPVNPASSQLTRHQHSSSLPASLPLQSTASQPQRDEPSRTRSPVYQQPHYVPFQTNLVRVNPTAERTAVTLPKAPSEETILMTPSSLANSTMLKPTNSRQSVTPSISSLTGKKGGLFNMFKKAPPQPSTQTSQQYEIWHPSTGVKTPESSPGQKPAVAHAELKGTPPTPTKPPSVEEFSIPVPIHGGDQQQKHSSATRVFTPFRYLTSKKNRAISVASMEAQDGTATNTVVGSPTASMHSQSAIIPPPVRDPRMATEEWRDNEEAEAKARAKNKLRRQRPGVVFDVDEDVPGDSQKRPRRRGTRVRRKEEDPFPS